MGEVVGQLAVTAHSDKYAVSSGGQIFSMHSGELREIGRCANGDGYFCFYLCGGGVRRLHLVHRIVAETFLGPAPFDGAVVMHRDSNRKNNSVDNLEWGSHADNARTRERDGRSLRGRAGNNYKLSSEQVAEIRRRVAGGETRTSVAAAFGLVRGTVGRIVNRSLHPDVP